MRTIHRFSALAALITFGAHAQTLPPPPVSPAPVTVYEYDAQGNPTKTLQAPGVPGFGFATTDTYDSLHRRRDSTDAKGGRTQFGHDALGRVSNVTDPRNLATQYTRNGLGDVTKRVSPDTGTDNATYDAAGNLKTRTDSRGVKASLAYDALQRLKTVLYTQSGQPNETHTWLYDQSDPPRITYGTGRLTGHNFPAGNARYGYSPQGRMIYLQAQVFEQAGANARVHKTVKYGYEGSGRVTSITYPSGRIVSFAYDRGYLSAISLQANASATPQPLLSDIQSEPFGPVSSWKWHMASGMQSHERVYDLSGRLVRYPLGNVVRDLTYDAGDRITRYTHYDRATAAPQPALDQSFGFDELGRLTGVTLNTASWSIGYDANGNRTGVTLNGSPSTYTTAATSNRLLSVTNPARSFSYDAAGNTVSDSLGYTGTFNLAGRLTTLAKAGVTTTYSYNALGQRVRKHNNLGSTDTVIFVYDFNTGMLLGEYGPDESVLKEYIWIDGMPVAMMTPDPANPGGAPLVYYIHSDHIDTPRVVVDRNNNLRWRWIAEPFGTTAAETNPAGLGVFTQNLRFPAQYFDAESGLHYNHFRSLDPSLNRYPQSDPIGLAGGLNTYTYANVNPVSYVDPEGLMGFGGGGSAGPGSRLVRQLVPDCSEWQFGVGVSGSAGFSPIFVPSGFIGGGLGVGFTSNGAVFVQAQATGSIGAGIFAGVGIQGSVSRSDSATSPGMSVSQSLQADFNFGAGPSVGGAVQWAPGNGGGAQGPLPGAGRFGVGYGLQSSIGITQTATFATPPLFQNRSCECRR